MSRKKRMTVEFLMILMMCLANLCACSEEAVEEITIEHIENEEESEEETEERKKTVIYIHICGAVKEPGVYELESGSRAAQAVEAAGGFKSDASEDSLNLARVLTDGEQIYVLTQEEQAEQTADHSITEDGIVNINTSDVEQLMTLSGIGESRANAIIAYREAHGDFRNIEEICEVDGIGESIYEKIRDKITIN